MTRSKISVVKFLLVGITMLMLNATMLLGQATVTLPTVSGAPGTEKVVDITTTDLASMNVLSYQFDISYDNTVVELTGVETDGTLIDNFGSYSVNPDIANGVIRFAWANSSALSGAGTLVKIKVKFLAVGTSALTFGSTFQFNAGTPTATTVNGSAMASQVLVNGGAVSAVTGDEIMIPIYVTELTSAYNVLSFDFNASFDPSVINITGYETAGTLSEGGSASINPNNTAGTVAFAWASASNVTGSGVLVYLKATAVGGGTSDLTFSAFQFNAGAPTVSADAGQVTVTAANVAPVLSISPAGPYAVDEGQNIQLQLSGTDANAGDVLTFSSTTPPSGATLNATSGLFSWTPAYNQAGSHTITFTVSDDHGASASQQVTITVNNVNRTPQFTTVPPPGTIVKAHRAPNPVYYNFLYTASDPDGDDLIFSMEEGPDGSSISSSGVFIWNVKEGQAGLSFVVTIKVTDGEFVVSTTQILNVDPIIVGVEDDKQVPSEYKLSQNYPNPFNPSTTIYFGLPKESHVKLSVYNILGQEVGVLVNKTMGAGYHDVNFDASKLNTGMYIYKIEAEDFVSVKKMLFVK